MRIVIYYFLCFIVTTLALANDGEAIPRGDNDIPSAEDMVKILFPKDRENIKHFPLRSIEFLPVKSNIPKGYTSYIISLIPSPDLVNDYSWVQKFKEKYQAFGESIGKNKIAIWLEDNKGVSIDVGRSKYYCDIFNLNYNDGPYIVITNNHPDSFKTGDEFVLIKLNNISKNRIIRVLNILEQDLRKERHIKKEILRFEEVKQRFISISNKYGKEIKDIVISWL